MEIKVYLRYGSDFGRFAVEAGIVLMSGDKHMPKYNRSEWEIPSARELRQGTFNVINSIGDSQEGIDYLAEKILDRLHKGESVIYFRGHLEVHHARSHPLVRLVWKLYSLGEVELSTQLRADGFGFNYLASRKKSQPVAVNLYDFALGRAEYHTEDEPPSP